MMQSSSHHHHHRHFWFIGLLIGYATSFVPHSIPSFQRHRHRTLDGWFGPFGGAENSDGSSSSEIGATNNSDDNTNNDDTKKPTDVYVSRVEDKNDNNDDDDTIIDVQATIPKKTFTGTTDYDVIIVGAGCAGIGTALMLTRTFGLDVSRVLMIEQGTQVGDSFRQWPEEMKFISPSFNQQGWTNSFDLNSIHYDTSPAFTLRSEHPSGEEYAIYLESIVNDAKLQVQLETKVTNIICDKGEEEKENDDDDEPGPFRVEICRKNSSSSSTETLSSRYIVWAAGEFQYPRDKQQKQPASTDNNNNDTNTMFPGADLCLHNSKVRSWKQLSGDGFCIIGGYESGIDAAVNLAKAGKRCTVLASTDCWNLRTGDPSSELAPYTSDRLRDVLSVDFTSGPRPELLSPIRVVAVEPNVVDGGFDVTGKWKALDDQNYNNEGNTLVVHTDEPPILCTGFTGSVAAAAGHLFDFPSEDDKKKKKKSCVGDGPLLTRDDESTKIPGIFLVGPTVSHGELSFCFVYKFRQRFGVVANAICEGLGMDTKAAVQECRQTNMYLDDFATCSEETCGDAC